jgi:thioredoxin 1
MVHELTDLSFAAFVQKDTCVVVDFYATWCPPCERLSQIMDEIAEEYGDQLVIGKLNVDKNPETTQKYGVMSMPTIIVFQRGQVVSNFVGARPKQNMLDLLGLGVM